MSAWNFGLVGPSLGRGRGTKSKPWAREKFYAGSGELLHHPWSLWRNLYSVAVSRPRTRLVMVATEDVSSSNSSDDSGSLCRPANSFDIGFDPCRSICDIAIPAGIMIIRVEWNLEYSTIKKKDCLYIRVSTRRILAYLPNR